MTTERDRINQMAYAVRVATEKGERKGIAKGRAEGLAEGEAIGVSRGHAEGSKEATLKIAKNLKETGIAPEIIASTTGLSEEEIGIL